MSKKWLARSVVPIAAAAVVAVALPAPEAQAATFIKCFGSSQIKCYYQDSVKADTWWPVYTDSYENTTSRSGSFDCSATVSKTDSFKVSISVSAEVSAAIFAKADVTVGGEIQSSVTSGYVTRAGISVPARTTTYCQRGIARDNFSGHVDTRNCGSSGCTTPVRTNYTYRGPIAARWKIWDA